MTHVTTDVPNTFAIGDVINLYCQTQIVEIDTHECARTNGTNASRAVKTLCLQTIMVELRDRRHDIGNLGKVEFLRRLTVTRYIDNRADVKASGVVFL